MGNYVYTMRKKRVRITDLHGDVQDAVLFSYAYKPSYSFAWNEEHKRVTGALDACAERAWDAFNDELVIVGDTEGGIANLDGCVVYKDVTGAFWTDCNEFPGIPVGFVKAEGKRLRIVSESDWWTPTFPDDRDFRRVVKDGKVKEEIRYHDASLQQWWETAQEYGLVPVSCNSWRVAGGSHLNAIEVWQTCRGWQVGQIDNNRRIHTIHCDSLRDACKLASSWGRQVSTTVRLS